MDSAHLIEIREARFEYETGHPILSIDRFDIQYRARVLLEGPSGSGKSTLLGLVAGVLTPDSGSVTVCGQALHALSAAERDMLRADHIGYIFQLFNLIPWLSVIDNVLLPARFSPARKRRLEGQGLEPAARRLLEHMELDAAQWRRPVAKLSVGQQQRVAAARALIGAPKLVIADEPTSALDATSRDRFIELLLHECQANETTLLLVSHDRELGRFFDQKYSMAELNQARRPA